MSSLTQAWEKLQRRPKGEEVGEISGCSREEVGDLRITAMVDDDDC